MASTGPTGAWRKRWRAPQPTVMSRATRLGIQLQRSIGTADRRDYAVVPTATLLNKASLPYVRQPHLDVMLRTNLRSVYLAVRREGACGGNANRSGDLYVADGLTSERFTRNGGTDSRCWVFTRRDWLRVRNPGRGISAINSGRCSIPIVAVTVSAATSCKYNSSHRTG